MELHEITKRGVIHFADDLALPQARVATSVHAPACHNLVWSHIEACE